MEISYEVCLLSFQMRLQLIKSVEKDKLSIFQSCKKLGIKKSTAKSILRNYRKKGRIFRRKSQERAEERNQLSAKKVQQISTPSDRIPQNYMNLPNPMTPTSIKDNEVQMGQFWGYSQNNLAYFQLGGFYPNCYFYLFGVIFFIFTLLSFSIQFLTFNLNEYLFGFGALSQTFGVLLS